MVKEVAICNMTISEPTEKIIPFDFLIILISMLECIVMMEKGHSHIFRISCNVDVLAWCPTRKTAGHVVISKVTFHSSR